MKKVVIILLLVALAAAGWFGYRRFRQQQSQAALSSLQTVAYTRGDLTATIGATGTVRSNQSTQLAWETSGTVEDINIEVGQQVSTGEVLASLAKTSLPQNVIMAAADLADAQQAMDDLLKPPTDLDLKQAQQAIANAEASVRDAEQRVANLQSNARQTDIDQAQANVVLAQNKLDHAKKQFEPYANKPEDNVIRATYQSKLAQAQKEYDNAVSLLNNLLGNANPIDLNVAESDMAVAKAQLADAQDSYQKLLDGPEQKDIDAAQARVDAAQATLEMQHITAPFDGTITEVQIKPGDQVAPGAVAFRLDDLSRLFVDVQVSEVDINRIQVGQEVILTFDAILAKEYHGVVSKVALVGTSDQGVVDFNVTVELKDADAAVKPGMTAAVNVVVSQLQNVYVVPNRAVRVLDGQRVVYVLRNGAPQPVDVTLGASSDTASQVLDSQLRPSDQIVLNPPVQFDQNGPPSFMGR
jgi:HlyD family secretion protein